LAKAILYTPHQNQTKIHNAINWGSEKYYILNIGRQFGKTLLATNQLLYWALNNKNVKCAWVSPTYKQSKKVFDEMYKAFQKRPEIYRTVNRSELLLEYASGSTIQFFSAERYDNIRGFTFEYLVCDEFAFMSEQAWTEVLRATVLVKGRKVLLISTPKGRNHFYKLYQMDGYNPQYKSFTMTSYDNPIIIPSEIDDAKQTLPDHVFRQEYLAEFIDGGAGMFKDVQINNVPEMTGRYYAGIDVGRADDYTVLTILNNKSEMVYCDRWRQMDWTEIVQKIKQQLEKYNPDTLIEVNSVGDAVFEMLRNEIPSVYIAPFVTTSKSKQDIIENLIVANQDKTLKVLQNEWLLKELEVFSYEYNPKTRSVKYSAPFGFHDDGVMSLAIAYQSFRQAEKTYLSSTFR
jgi:phage terminase large subunit-like protein